ncbi:MAG: PilZ domain-containing protein [Acidobacteriia bacterium]|nr:PilZ domain-containing protein [Terriglobia bacterium]
MSPALQRTTCSTPINRRRHLRFPITAHAEYLLQGRRCAAVTRDVGSGGILIESTDVLPVGELVELCMDWPRRLDGRCPLRLVVAGEVLRSTSRGTAIRILRYEYRLAPKAPPDLQKLDQEAGKLARSS